MLADTFWEVVIPACRKDCGESMRGSGCVSWCVKRASRSEGEREVEMGGEAALGIAEEMKRVRLNLCVPVGVLYIF